MVEAKEPEGIAQRRVSLWTSWRLFGDLLMVCYCPLWAYDTGKKTDNGKRLLTFDGRKASRDFPDHIELPCGQCVGCRLERSRQWAVRCSLEAKEYNENCFITLTYNDDSLPARGSLDVRHFQLFMKRLRKRYSDRKIKVMYCGEYGDVKKSFRPHFHACLFNLDFEDKKYFFTKNGKKIYTSAILDDVWQRQGHASTAALEFASAAYVARYTLKKVTGQFADGHYLRVDKDTGEFYSLTPEFAFMSNEIGKAWYTKYLSDVYPSDEVVCRGRRMRPPRYFDVLLERNDPELLEELKVDRAKQARKFAYDNTPDRRRVRETVQLKRLEMLPRNLE